MAAGTTRKISAASARAHTRKPKSKSPSLFSGIIKKVLLVSLVGFLAWAYQATQPPPPKTCGSKDGLPVTAPRIQLKDGRHLAYKEFGVPKDNAKHKIVFVHGFDSCRHDVAAITATLSPEIVESEGVYIVSFDRPGYGESDPNPNQTDKSIALDIEELADQLGLGSKFYVVGFSLGGQIVWHCLKYIPHRLKRAALIAPVVNYWWPGLPSNLTAEEFKQQLPQDQWALRVSHYMPWLNYWWNTRKLFPGFSLISHNPNILSPQDAELLRNVLSRQDAELLPRIVSIRQEYMAQVRQQGEFVSLHRDIAFAFGNSESNPMDLKNPFPEGGGSVHLWQGDEDPLVPATLQRHIARQLPWIHYHEVAGAGHMFLFADGIADSVIGGLIGEEKGL